MQTIILLLRLSLRVIEFLGAKADVLDIDIALDLPINYHNFTNNIPGNYLATCTLFEVWSYSTMLSLGEASQPGFCLKCQVQWGKSTPLAGPSLEKILENEACRSKLFTHKSGNFPEMNILMRHFKL